MRHWHKTLAQLWTRSSATPVNRQFMEASSLCFTVHVGDRAQVCPNREGGSGNHMGMQKVRQLSDWKTLSGRNRPQAPEHLDALPPRVLRFRLRLDRLDYDIKHVPGKELYTADTLSRAPSTSFTLQDLAEICIMAAITHLPASDQRLATYKHSQRIHSASWSCSIAEKGGRSRNMLTPQFEPTGMSKENSPLETDYSYKETASSYQRHSRHSRKRRWKRKCPAKDAVCHRCN